MIAHRLFIHICSLFWKPVRASPAAVLRGLPGLDKIIEGANKCVPGKRGNQDEAPPAPPCNERNIVRRYNNSAALEDAHERRPELPVMPF